MKNTLYFDFLSPFSFFLWFEIPNKEDFDWKPIVLAKVLNHWGQKGPGEIEPKRKSLFRYCMRLAEQKNLKFTAPQSHPFNPLYALRLATFENCGNQATQIKVIDCLWKAGWQHGIELSEPDHLITALENDGLDGKALLEGTYNADVKQALKKNTTEAIERGVFGVPTISTANENFWGLDSYPHFLASQQGNIGLDEHAFKLIMKNTTPSASQNLSV